MRTPAAFLGAFALLGVHASIVAAQSAPPGAPPAGVQLQLQAGVPFSRFLVSGDDTPGNVYGNLRGQNLQVRLSRHVVSATSGWLEGGNARRGSRLNAPGEATVDLRVNWWELGGGLNVALRCVSDVCPSVDGGAVIARKRAALLRETSQGRLLGGIPIARYEGSAIVGLRLAVPRLRGLALTLRHQEGFTDLRPDLEGTTVRSRTQTIGIGFPLGQ
jgi:hypothetical protein